MHCRLAACSHVMRFCRKKGGTDRQTPKRKMVSRIVDQGPRARVVARSSLMDGFVTQFLTYLRIERQASAHTLRSYEHDLALYCRYRARGQGGRGRPERGRSGSAAALFGVADRSRLRRQHRRPSPGQFALVLPVSPQARDWSVQTPRLVFVIPSRHDGYLDCCGSTR